MRLSFALICAILIISLASGAEEVQQVNPGLILKECTEAKGICRETAATCSEYHQTVNELFSWTGLKILIAMALIIMATWFTVFTLFAFYRYIMEWKTKKERIRYIDQLEENNKELLLTIERFNTILHQVGMENEKLVEGREILKELLGKNIPMDKAEIEPEITKKGLFSIPQILKIAIVASPFIVLLIFIILKYYLKVI